jgi:transposase-like protein
MQATTQTLRLATEPAVKSTIDDLVRKGARQMLQQAIEDEVAEYVERHKDVVDQAGQRMVVRNGRKPARSILTSAGAIEVRQPRVNDRRIDEHGQRMRFTSAILPPYLRKAQSIEKLVPWLYLKGISTSDFAEAFECLGLEGAAGFSATSVVRMKEIWQQEWQEWNKRSLAGKQYVYVWADGIHFNVRLEEDCRPCVLVLMGATADGTKELIAIHDGERESEMSWHELLLDAKSRGLTEPPKVATGDGALGFWSAMSKVFPGVVHQRCWVHKTANVLNKLPRGMHAAAKAKLHDIWLAGTRAEAIKAFDLFVATYEAKHPKAVECLKKDRDVLLAFYDCPAEHWSHLRTTNPIESTFATVRLRTARTKGSGSRSACLTMVFKLCQEAERHWRKLNGSPLLEEIVRGIQFVDGVRKVAA